MSSTYSFVILVPEGRDSNVKSNAKGKCTNKYAGHEDAFQNSSVRTEQFEYYTLTVAFDEGIVEAVRKLEDSMSTAVLEFIRRC